MFNQEYNDFIKWTSPSGGCFIQGTKDEYGDIKKKCGILYSKIMPPNKPRKLLSEAQTKNVNAYNMVFESVEQKGLKLKDDLQNLAESLQVGYKQRKICMRCSENDVQNLHFKTSICFVFAILMQ